MQDALRGIGLLISVGIGEAVSVSVLVAAEVAEAVGVLVLILIGVVVLVGRVVLVGIGEGVDVGSNPIASIANEHITHRTHIPAINPNTIIMTGRFFTAGLTVMGYTLSYFVLSLMNSAAKYYNAKEMTTANMTPKAKL